MTASLAREPTGFAAVLGRGRGRRQLTRNQARLLDAPAPVRRRAELRAATTRLALAGRQQREPDEADFVLVLYLIAASTADGDQETLALAAALLAELVETLPVGWRGWRTRIVTAKEVAALAIFALTGEEDEVPPTAALVP